MFATVNCKEKCISEQAIFGYVLPQYDLHFQAQNQISSSMLQSASKS